MTILVVGASGATGQLLVEQLLEQGESVKIIVRSMDALSDTIKNHENVSFVIANLLDLDESEMAQHVEGCYAVASCLGHNITFKGVFCPPRKLVTDATRGLCNAIESCKNEAPVKFVLMNSSGVSNPDLSEKISFKQQCVITLLRLLIPPHLDNEKATDFLRTVIGQNNNMIEWTAVRPDGLIDDIKVSEYTAHSSPIRSAIFDAGTISRINVAHFMASLITNHDTWKQWKGQMPVIYSNK